MSCSLARTLELVGDWWSPLIVRDLFLGIGRFDDLTEDLGISRNLLTRRLKLLIDNGIISKNSIRAGQRGMNTPSQARDLILCQRFLRLPLGATAGP